MANYGMGLFPGVVGKGIGISLVLIVLFVGTGSFIASSLSPGYQPKDGAEGQEAPAVEANADPKEAPKADAKEEPKADQ